MIDDKDNDVGWNFCGGNGANISNDARATKGAIDRNSCFAVPSMVSFLEILTTLHDRVARLWDWR